LVASSTAAADPAERLEATAIMGVDRFGDDIGLGSSQAPEQRPQSAPLVGARLTWVGLRTGGDTYLGIGAEAELSFTASWTGYGFDTRRESYFAPLFGYRGGLLVRWGGGRIEPHLSAGAGGVTIASASPFMAKETDPVFYWAVGATFPVGDRWQLRLDGRQAVMPGRMDGTTATAYQLQIAVGGRLAPSRRSEPVRIEVVAEPEPPRPDPNLDSDGDGIPDRLDKCPNEPELFNGFEDDDGCPEQDPDGDGIFGAADQCPNDPEDKDGFQDADGCPDPDNDGDGIPDTRDACPDQPETFNGIDDEDGCPDEIPPTLLKGLASASVVKFDANRPRLSDKAKIALDMALVTMLNYPRLKVMVTVHPDKAGDAAAELAKKRAEVVKWYLIEQGIAADQLDTAVGPVAAKNAPLLVLSVR
jgi:outer membrane protein OmpA-like peptidoglycan-associated protein